MQRQQKSSIQDFRETFNKIDYFYHVKEFKNFTESKIIHLKPQQKFHPPDYYVQMRRLLLHMVYLYYVAYTKKIEFYLYPKLCMNKWGVIFRYYSFQESSEKFMDKISYEDFKQNVKNLFVDIWGIKNKEQKEEQRKEEEGDDQNENNGHGKKSKTPWREFADQFVIIFEQKNLSHLSPKDIISRFEETKHMKNNVLIVGVLSSTIFPIMKFNKSVQKVFEQIYINQPFIMSKIFNEAFSSEGTKEFMNCIIRFFKILNDHKILGITTTISDKQSPKSQDDESMLTEFVISLGRSLVQKELPIENTEVMEEKNPTSNKSSEHDYSQGNEGRELGQLKCQYFWSKKTNPKELTFRVSIFINKKIYPLYFRQIQDVWYKLSEKWKVILDENKQLSGFNPGFIILGYNKDSYQLSFTEYVKCQPIQNSISQLIIATDKLIIATLVMRDIICFYERKSLSVQIMKDELVINDGRLQDLAKSICQSIRNYYSYYKQVINTVEEKIKH